MNPTSNSGYHPSLLRQRYFHRGLMVAALLLFFFLALDSVVHDSPTVDEQSHLARGLAFLHTGDPRLSLEHPPLINVLSTLPLLTLPELRLPLDHSGWETGNWFEFAAQLVWEYNQDVTRMFFLARLPVIFLTIGLALTGYHFASTLWFPASGLFAFLFLLFEPNILAHGRYTTTDVGGALFLLLAALALWHLWYGDRWSWRRLLLAGAALGLAFGSKLSAPSIVVLFALVAVLPVIYNQSFRWQVMLRSLVQLGVASLLGLMVVWAVYAFEWGAFRFDRIDSLIALNQYSGPMPTFWAGLGRVVAFSRGDRPAFLLGQYSDTGFPHYFIVAFFTKTPLPVIFLILFGAIYLLWHRETRGRALYLLIPSSVYFLILTQNNLNIGYRHLLPVLPMWLVVGSGLAQFPRFSPRRFFQPGRRLTQMLLPLLLLATIGADLWIHPHYLSYFNLAAGGPEAGRNILVDSNIDWGQDLLRLRAWMEENEVDQIKLAWYGSAQPEYYGIEYTPLPSFPGDLSLWANPPFSVEDPEPGVYAISVTNLWEYVFAEKDVYHWFRQREPDDRVGYSIMIYRVEE